MTAFGVAACLIFVSTDLAAQTSGEEREETAEPSDGGSEKGDGSFDVLVQQGKVHFTEGNYEKALESFERAYEIEASPNLLFNIGLAAEKSGDLEQALHYYEKFVVSPEVTLELREKAQKRIDVLEPIVEDQKSKEKKAEQTSELDQSDELAAAQKDGEASDSSGGESAGSQAKDEARGGSPVGGILLTGVGLASIAGGVVFTLSSEQAKQRFETAESPSARRSARDAAWRNQWIADGMFAVGLGTAIAGTVVLVNHGKSGGSETSTALIPALGPDFAGLRFRAPF